MFHLTIGKRLGLGFGTIAVIALALGLVGYYRVVESNQVIHEFGQVRLPGVKMLFTLSEAQTALSSAENALLSTHLDAKTREAQHQRIAAARRRMDEAWTQYQAWPKSVEEAAIWQSLAPAWSQWRNHHAEYVRQARGFDAIGVTDPQALLKVLYDVRGTFWKMIAVLNRHFQTGAPLTDSDRLNTPLASGAGNWIEQIKTDNPVINQGLQQIQPLNATLITSIQAIQQAISGGEKAVAEREFAERLYPSAMRIIELMRPMRQEATRAIQLYEQMNRQAALNRESVAAVEMLLFGLVEINTQQAADAVRVAEQRAGFAKAFDLAATLIGVALALALALIISRSVVRPLKAMVALLGQFAGGDISQEVSAALRQRRDEAGELAQAMQTLGEELRRIMGEVTHSSTQVNSAAREIAQGSADLSQRTEEQASALEETAASMEQLTSTVKQSADHAGQANQLACAARSQAEQGGQVVGRAISAMGAIYQSSRRVADIISVIDEIAFQTNLLALNAAVEAARAGEQGRGFAVVAGEVRKLAQRSGDAAREIRDLIKDSVNKVEDGGKLVDQTGHTLEEIMTAAKKVSDIVAEMAAAAREQASGIEQVNKAILQMDQATQQNAALVEQTAAASHAMGDQALQLQTLMGFFTLPDQGPAEPVVQPALTAPGAVRHLDHSGSAPSEPTTPVRWPAASFAPVPQSGGSGDWRKTGRVVAASGPDGEWEEF